MDRGERMTFAKMEHIPLKSAYLCQDCNCIGNCSTQCPACASVVLLGLANVLNREAEVKVEHKLLPMPAFFAA
jgi:hypothetical protein